MEFASNHGAFGSGNFTDHSSLDVVPALIAGVVAAGLAVALRVRSHLADANGPSPDWLAASDKALGSGLGRLLPIAFALQIAALYSMETLEQIAVYGHDLGGALWLGAPLVYGLAAHAVACVAIVFALARGVGALAGATVRVLGLIRTFVNREAQRSAESAMRGHNRVLALPHFAFCCLGERAPPPSIA